MLQIQDTLVSLDLAERFFCCDIDACLGECCIEGDAGAPITPEEKERIDALMPVLKPRLLPSALNRIEEAGTGYVDEEGDLVTQIVEGRNCVFTSYAPGGVCQCAIECACSAGETGGFRKPSSCALYPVRLTEYPTFTAVNYHRWDICRPAEKLGRKLGIRLYQFLKGPLTERFGAEWYAELCEACEAYLAEYGDK
ncbi:MAG: DUF3109 family protein [Muribaculaceae bacterium]|nr:DUF3109 family protein [Muribaculaceae bacterium]